MRALCAILLALSAGALGAWLVTLTVSDRFYWSQWLDWVPDEAYLLGAASALGLSTLAARRAPPVYAVGGDRPPFRAGRLTLLVMLVGGAAWYGCFQLRLLNALRPAPPDDAVRAIFWNAAAGDSPDWAAHVLAHRPDIAGVVGVRHTDGFGAFEPMIGNGTFISSDRFAIATRFPVVRWGHTRLGLPRGEGLDPRDNPNARRWPDPGRALFAQMESPGASDRLFTVWLIDMPSDLSLPRFEIAEAARRALSAMCTNVFVADGAGGWKADAAGPAPFPDPDLVMGDFNIPRGSASLALLTGNLPNAFDEAGFGLTVTFPRRFPLIHIDNAFVSGRWRAAAYRTVDLGSGTHLGQFLRLAPAESR